MYCPNCGIEIHVEGAFCAKCRKDIAYLTKAKAGLAAKPVKAEPKFTNEELDALEFGVEQDEAKIEAAVAEAAGNASNEEMAFADGTDYETGPNFNTAARLNKQVDEPVDMSGMNAGKGFYCNACGTFIFPEDNYCYKCGKASRKEYYKETGSIATKKRLVGAGAVAAAGIAAAAVIAYLKSGN